MIFLYLLIDFLNKRQRKNRKKKIIHYYEDEYGEMVYYTISPDGTKEYINVIFK